jgi:alpha-L-rhamnosidase
MRKRSSPAHKYFLLKRFIGLACCCAFFLFATAGTLSVSVSSLTCEYRHNPLGIESASPAFSWMLNSNERNFFQSAYEIVVGDQLKAVTAEKGNMWTTGKILSSETTLIEYKGSPLQSNKRYYWKVRVYDKSGKVSLWSEVAWFETAMLHHEDWTAKWIGDGNKQPEKDEDYYKEDRAPLFRRPFSVKKNLLNARLYISGLGYYEAWLNGKRIGDQVLDPGFTTYRKEVLYSVYDITAMINRGTNVAGVMLGNGWWNPLPFKFFGRWDLRQYQQTGRPCLKAEIRLEYKDHSIEKIVTDEAWQTAPGPVIHNNVYLGETYDARLEQKNWTTTKGSSAAWKKAVLVNGPEGKLSVQEQPPIKITRTVNAVRVKEQGKDTFIVDLGQNFAGAVRIRVNAAAGQRISLRYGEELFPDGRLNYMTTVATQIKKGGISGGPGAPATAWQQDNYITKGEGVETWSPHFTFHGFRYVEVTGWPGVPSTEDIVGLRMNAALQQNGSFSCSEPLFNQLHEMIQWTFLSNVFSVQSDCPGREKMGYGGDMVATCESFLYNYDMAGFYAKTIQDFANEQRPEGGITEIAPFTGIADRGYGDDSGPLGWQLAFPYLQKQLYEFYGDKRILSRYYPAFKKQMNFLESRSYLGLFHWDISDHEALDPKPEAFSASAFYFHHAKLAEEFAGLLGEKEDSIHFNKLAAQIKNLIVRKYLVPGTGRFDNATESAQVLALWYGLSPETEGSWNVLLQELKRHKGHLSTGIFTTKMIFDILRETDRSSIAYDIVSQRQYPGWLYMIDRGATTLWESWSYPGTVYSANHPMFGSIDEWFYRSVSGINAGAPGFSKIIIKPQPGNGLTWAKGAYQSIRGEIISEWRKENGSFSLHVVIPPNTTATIYVPALEGRPVIEKGKDMKISGYDNGYAIIETGSGEYDFVTAITGSSK